jgi:hypothetical protein
MQSNWWLSGENIYVLLMRRWKLGEIQPLIEEEIEPFIGSERGVRIQVF